MLFPFYFLLILNMGAAFSEQEYRDQNYSEWERTYVTPHHGGRPVLSLVAISDNQFYDDMIVDSKSIPLLYVHGVRNIANLRMAWDHPTTAEGSITFIKTDFDGNLGVTVTVPVPENATSIDLSGHRALFVAYRDCLVQLKAEISLPNVNQVRLSSSLN